MAVVPARARTNSSSSSCSCPPVPRRPRSGANAHRFPCPLRPTNPSIAATMTAPSHVLTPLLPPWPPLANASGSSVAPLPRCCCCCCCCPPLPLPAHHPMGSSPPHPYRNPFRARKNPVPRPARGSAAPAWRCCSSSRAPSPCDAVGSGGWPSRCACASRRRLSRPPARPRALGWGRIPSRAS